MQSQDKFLIVGGGGRESAFALKLYQDVVLYALISHENPTIVDCVKQSGGDYLVTDVGQPANVLAFALKHQIDYVFVSADEPLANGVIDILLANNIKAIGGTKAATRIEWDKVYSIEMVQQVCPQLTPFYQVVSDEKALGKAIDLFIKKGLDIVVKPQGLTGGKGVKVMPEHLPSYQDALAYGRELLKNKNKEKVLLVEKLQGIEFTIMGITDGKNIVLAPASYDYPFRFEGDTGAGTGGMGCFTSASKKLPFMSDKDLLDCQNMMEKIIDEMAARKLLFNGVLNGGFFKTANGIKFMEFNSRFGDPEGLNVLSVLACPFGQLLKDIYQQKLTNNSLKFLKKASVVKYLVAPEYPDASATETIFSLDKTAIEASGVEVIFATCIKTGHQQYQTLKKSRVVALVATADDINTASEKINQVISKHISGNLAYRADIGSQQYLKKLTIMAQP